MTREELRSAGSFYEAIVATVLRASGGLRPGVVVAALAAVAEVVCASAEKVGQKVRPEDAKEAMEYFRAKRKA